MRHGLEKCNVIALYLDSQKAQWRIAAKVERDIQPSANCVKNTESTFNWFIKWLLWHINGLMSITSGPQPYRFAKRNVSLLRYDPSSQLLLMSITVCERFDELLVTAVFAIIRNGNIYWSCTDNWIAEFAVELLRSSLPWNIAIADFKMHENKKNQKCHCFNQKPDLIALVF